MENKLSGVDSFVVFHNSQGLMGRGTLVHITRRSVVFEVYNPYSLVQISEVLTGFHVLRGERTIYNGKAIVSSLVTTGLMVIVSVTLSDPWADQTGLPPGHVLQSGMKQFIRDWETSYSIRPSYQLSVSSISNFLAELSRWVEEAETDAFDSDDTKEEVSLHQAFFEDIIEPVNTKLNALYMVFEEEARQVPPEEFAIHKAFVQRTIHPFILCAPFVHRTYTKPLGYAGDYEMVNMMLKESPDVGTSIYAKVIHEFYIRAKTPESHRNRIIMLEKRLKIEAKKFVAKGRPFKVLNVGCGPAVEVQRFFKTDPLSNNCIFHLMDFNEETLEYTHDKIQASIIGSKNNPLVKCVHKSVDDLLKEAFEDQGPEPVLYDMVYCAGLFDYFTNQICKHLLQLFYKWLLPEGLLTVTNVHPKNPVRSTMEYMLEWHLIYRDEIDMEEIAPPGIKKTITSDVTGLNVFLDIRKE